MVNTRLASACLVMAAALLMNDGNAMPVQEQKGTASHHSLVRRRPAFHGLEGDELVAWAEQHRAALRAKYASKLKDSSRQTQQRRSENPIVARDTATGESLTNYQHDSTFYAPVSIGTPAQTVNLVLDTGSSDMWTVQGKSDWNPAASSTFTNTSTQFSVSYGSGDVHGTLASDTVTLAGHTAAKQTFAIATSISNGLLGANVEGIMGLGFRSLSTSKATPFWQTAGSSEFSFYLEPTPNSSKSDTSPGGTFTLGGTNTSFYQGDINWSNVIDESYWLITLGGITVNSQSIDIGSTNKVAVDTGTTLIGVPDAVVKAIYANVQGSQEMASGYYTFPCSGTTLSATMHFGNQEYSLTSDNLIAGTTDSQGKNCLGSFFSIGSSSNDELQYILGDAFLMNVYSIFNYQASGAQVGFASLAPGLSTSTQSTTVNQVVAASGAARTVFAAASYPMMMCFVSVALAILLA